MAKMIERLETHVLGDGDWIDAAEICELCRLDLAAILELAELGIVSGRESVAGEWQLAATALPRLRIAGRLMHDLGVNASGAALALELLEAQRELERRIESLERLVRY